jgi:hypothetical protein
LDADALGSRFRHCAARGPSTESALIFCFEHPRNQHHFNGLNVSLHPMICFSANRFFTFNLKSGLNRNRSATQSGGNVAEIEIDASLLDKELPGFTPRDLRPSSGGGFQTVAK